MIVSKYMSMDKLKLYYWNGGNFGDEINVDIWHRLLEGCIDVESEYIRGDKSPLFIGIGTLLNNQVPKENHKVIFGSGVGYGKPQMDESWNIAFVRGPLSCKELGLDESWYITDPAILLTEFYSKKTRQGKIGFMPHHDSLESVNWAKLCEDMEITYLDPTADYNETLTILLSCEFIIAEAMHAAIVADAFDIPWSAVSLHGHINTFKWEDWSKSLDLDFCMHKPPWPGRLIKRPVPLFLQKIKSMYNYAIAKRMLGKVKSGDEWTLSSKEIRAEKISQIKSKINSLNRQYSG